MAATINDLLALMARLRAKEDGCPWDVAQNFATVAPYTIEEAYEVAEAIARNDMAGLRDELGDLLFQVVFHARMAEEAGAFDFSDVVAGVHAKMVRRHPHVFGDFSIADAEAQTRAWEDHKAAERQQKAAGSGQVASALDDVALGIPALLRAVKLQKRAARVGFDWDKAADVLAKVDEEIGELRAEIAAAGSTGDEAREPIEEEFGDVLFACANLARHLDIDPESALRKASTKFERRFRKIEQLLAKEDKTPTDVDQKTLDRLWTMVKSGE